MQAHAGLESMDLDSVFFYAIIDEEVGDLGTMVSLELDDLTHFLMIDKSTIASKFLLISIKLPYMNRKTRLCC